MGETPTTGESTARSHAGGVLRRSILLLITLILLITAISMTGAAYAISSFLPSLASSLQNELSRLFGAQVSMQSSSFQIFPVPRIVLSGIALTSEVEKKQIASIDSILIRFEILPLLNKKLVVEEIGIQSPQASVQWTDKKLVLTGQKEPPASLVDPPASSLPMRESSNLNQKWEVILQRVQVQGGQVYLSSAEGKKLIKLEHLATSLHRNGSVLEFGNPKIQGFLDSVPIALSASHLAFDQVKGTINLQNGLLVLSDHELLVHGEWGPHGGDIEISSKRFSLAMIHSILNRVSASSPIPISTGEVSGNLKINGNLSELVRVEGTLQADNMKSARDFSLKGLRIDDFLLELANAGPITVRAGFSMQDFHFADGEDIYEANSVKGSVNYSAIKAQDKKVTGDIAVTGFGYQDSKTRVSEVNGSFSKISARVDGKGGAQIIGILSGSSVKVIDPNIVVEQAHSVSAPLEISIPANGGYAVQGPVTVSGGAITLLNRRLSNLDGTVAMLVSGPLGRYKSDKLEGKLGERPLTAKVDFSMTPANYQLATADFTLGAGSISGTLSLERSGQRNAHAKLAASNIALEEFSGALQIPPEYKVDGTLSHLECRAQAEMGNLIGTVRGNGSFEILQGGPSAERATQKLFRAVAAIPLAGTPLKAKDEMARGARHQIQSEFDILDKHVSSKKTTLVSPSCTVNGKGAISFEGAVNGKAQVIFLRESFSNFGLGFDRLGKLLGQAGQIQIPLNISGQISDPKFEPDLVQLAKNNTGLPLVKSALKTTRDIGETLVRGITGTSDTRMKEEAPTSRVP